MIRARAYHRRNPVFCHLSIAALLLIAACHDRGANPGNGQAGAVLEPPVANVPASPAPANNAVIPSGDAPVADGNAGVPAGGAFQPLGSQAVKDAIHRALNAGTTQRWQDGGLSGYAVPSQTADAHGCRSVRYTVDQQPGASYPVITACDAGR